ncbi:glycosyltransferase [Fulvivirgaceae bacterium BMA10]|uniref:Glycosyltransferase n=1 Tax=Splendidivirga corallicola TaxID=3051826 RepID=A0ABT8KQ94_9BACT|nr:glycosyltransferase [Fulvivirgaceae bacterium BMA10]
MMLWIFIILSIAYFLLTSTFLFGWLSIKKLPKNQQNNSHSTAVSIIIPVRNEEENILDLLSDIGNQEYPKDLIEVIVVDDNSEDATVDIIQKNQDQFDFSLQLIEQKDEKPFNGSHKKRSITQGVQLAKGELIFNTDGDCRFKVGWIRDTVRLFRLGGYSFISGPVTFFRSKNLFEKLQTMEFSGLIGAGAASLNLGFPNMCNGANLAYTKKVFQEVNGFEGYEQLPSGDDEFLMQKIYKISPSKVVFNRNASCIAYTSAKDSFKEFLFQRRRWAGKWKFHKDIKIQLLAMFIFLFNLFTLSTFLCAVLGNCPMDIFFAGFVTRLIVDALFTYNVLKFLGHRFSFFYFLILELVYPLYVIFFGIISNFGQYEWKGRILNHKIDE